MMNETAGTTDYFDGHLGKWVAMIHLTLMNLMDEELIEYGLSRATFGFLVHLYIEDGQRQDQLCREVIVNKSTVTRAVQKLKELGYVRCHLDKMDRRVVRVFLTSHAKAIREELIEILDRHSEILGRGFTGQQKTELLKTLKRVYNNVLDYKNERQKKVDDIGEK